ncbi:hypothetical protein JYT89_03085 [Flavobacteriaceae bacterium AH-315-B10]|nr:hypothetical protein [Flavobacteriaceae bacterium AH-315-B10]
MAKNTFDKQYVTNLLNKNKKRLLIEISQSKELLYLIKESTIRQLADEEKSKIKTQLLDIFKTIPALAIFLLPGGILLLPLAVKLIPNLLPSSFSENFDEEE